MKNNGRKPKRFHVYLPHDIHREVQRLANRERRSFCGAVIWLIQRGLEKHNEQRELARANTLLNSINEQAQ